MSSLITVKILVDSWTFQAIQFSILLWQASSSSQFNTVLKCSHIFTVSKNQFICTKSRTALLVLFTSYAHILCKTLWVVGISWIQWWITEDSYPPSAGHGCFATIIHSKIVYLKAEVLSHLLIDLKSSKSLESVSYNDFDLRFTSCLLTPLL